MHNVNLPLPPPLSAEGVGGVEPSTKFKGVGLGVGA